SPTRIPTRSRRRSSRTPGRTALRSHSRSSPTRTPTRSRRRSSPTPLRCVTPTRTRRRSPRRGPAGHARARRQLGREGGGRDVHPDPVGEGEPLLHHLRGRGLAVDERDPPPLAPPSAGAEPPPGVAHRP